MLGDAGEFLGPMVLGNEVESAVDVFRLDETSARSSHGESHASKLPAGIWKQRKPACLCGNISAARAPRSRPVFQSAFRTRPKMLLEKIRKEVDAGYQRIKIKIKPGWDLKIIERVRKEFPDIRLMGDANSAYKLSDVPLFQQLDQFNLMMLEQPLAHDDIFDHAVLQRQIQTPVCLDESIRSAEDATHAIALESCRIINVKLGRVGGHAEAKRIERVSVRQ